MPDVVLTPKVDQIAVTDNTTTVVGTVTTNTVAMPAPASVLVTTPAAQGPQGIQGNQGVPGQQTDSVALVPATSSRNVIQPAAANVVPLILRGAASQTGDYFQVQNNTGGSLVLVNSAGTLSVDNGIVGRVAGGEVFNASQTNGVVVTSRFNNQTALYVRGLSGQTSSLLQVQNSGGQDQFIVGPSGAIKVRGDNTAGDAIAIANAIVLTKQDISNQLVLEGQNNRAAALLRFGNTGPVIANLNTDTFELRTGADGTKGILQFGTGGPKLTGSTAANSGLISSAPLDLSAAAGSLTASGSGVGDKLALYGGGTTNYGLGVQSNTLVAYLPALGAAGFAIRQQASSGAYSSGTDAVRLNADGSIAATGVGTFSRVNVGLGTATDAGPVLTVGRNASFSNGARLNVVGFASGTNDSNIEIGDNSGSVFWRMARTVSNTFEQRLSSMLTMYGPGASTSTFVIQQVNGQSGDQQQWRAIGGAPQFAIIGGGLPKWSAAGMVQSTVGAAGNASATPSSPSKYLKVVGDDGVTYVVPAYAAS